MGAHHGLGNAMPLHAGTTLAASLPVLTMPLDVTFHLLSFNCLYVPSCSLLGV